MQVCMHHDGGGKPAGWITDEHVRYNGKTETTIYRPSIHRADVYQSRLKAGNSLKMTNRQRYLFDLQEILVVESINGN